MSDGAHKVKADIEKNFGGKWCPWLILTDSENSQGASVVKLSPVGN